MSNRLRILVLAANPKDTSKLALEAEHQLLRNRMHDNMEAANCELLVEWAARPFDLQLALKNNKPHVVHFAGHGDQEGISLEDDEGKSLPVSKEMLAMLLDAGRPELRLVVLNACSSALQLNKLKEVVDYIVGTKAPVRDEIAVSFTAHFYEAVAVGGSVREAFLKAQGKLADSGAGQHAENYELLIRKGVNENTPLLPPFLDNVNDINIRELEGKIDFANVISDGLELASEGASQLNQKNKQTINSERATGELRFANVIQTGLKKA